MMSIEEKQFELNKNKILNVLNEAYKSSFYHRIFNNNSIKINKNIKYSDFKKIPITTKKDLRDNYLDFIDKNILSESAKISIQENRGDYSTVDSILYNYNLELYITSGSTGYPLEIIRSINDMKKNYVELNRFRLNFTNLKYLEKYIWVLPESIASRKYVFNEDNAIFKINEYGYIACFELINANNLNEFIHFCEQNKISAIIAWPTFLEKLVEFIEEKGIHELKHVQYIETNSEFLTNEQRNKIEGFFDINLLNVYSGNETNFIAASNEDNLMYLLHNNVFLELIPNECGYYETIITNLNTNGTFLIRYNLGDIAEWCYDVNNSKIGKYYPFKFRLMNYRSNDYFISKDGQKYEFNIIADPIHFAQIKYDMKISKYKVIQIDFDQIDIYLSMRKYEKEKLEKLKQLLNDYLLEVLKYRIKINIIYGEIKNARFEDKYRFFESRIRE